MSTFDYINKVIYFNNTKDKGIQVHEKLCYRALGKVYPKNDNKQYI